MIYDENIMLELCKELNIEVINENGYSMFNGTEISPNYIDNLFNVDYDDIFSIKTGDSIKGNDEIITLKWEVSKNDVSAVDMNIPFSFTETKKNINNLKDLNQLFNYEYDSDEIDFNYLDADFYLSSAA